MWKAKALPSSSALSLRERSSAVWALRSPAGRSNTRQNSFRRDRLARPYEDRGRFV